MQMLSTFVCAVVMLCFGGFGGTFDEGLRIKHICVCSYDVMFWWFGVSLMIIQVVSAFVCAVMMLCYGVFLMVIQVLSTFACAVMMLFLGGRGGGFVDYSGFKYNRACSYDVAFWCLWEHF